MNAIQPPRNGGPIAKPVAAYRGRLCHVLCADSSRCWLLGRLASSLALAAAAVVVSGAVG